ncbi:hypothetical protein AEYBE204_16545 [Asticcacaulis sp. YBE204]|nr:hypothetical protein AEYBE204_16545 [Asticcacaulis sp. YBE204]
MIDLLFAKVFTQAAVLTMAAAQGTNRVQKAIAKGANDHDGLDQG